MKKKTHCAIGYDELNNQICAGLYNNESKKWIRQDDVTDSAIVAVARHMAKAKQAIHFAHGGAEYRLKVEPVLP